MSHNKNYNQQDTEASPLIGQQSSAEGPHCEEQYRRFREKYRVQFSLGWLLFLVLVGAITYAVNYSKMAHTPDCDSDRKRTSALLLSFFFGVVGADRFYLGYPLLGAIKVITGGVAGIWWAIDLVLIYMGVLIDSNGCALQ